MKIALVGVGHIHIPGVVKCIQDRDDIRVKYVWDHEAQRAQRRATELEAQVSDKLETIWRDDEVKAAVILSETDRHRELVVAGAQAGKDLFVEKPLGLGGEDARAMADAIEQAGIQYQTGLNFRTLPVYRWLREQIREGLFGKVTRARVSVCHGGALKDKFDTEWRWMADPAQAGGGGFFDLGAHALDLMLWLLGDVAEVTASIGSAVYRFEGCDEFGEGMLRFTSGAVGTVASGWADVANPVEALIAGTEGHALVMNDGSLYLQVPKMEGADGKTPFKGLPERGPQALDLFFDYLNGKGERGLVPVREAVRACRVMEALYEGHRERKWIQLEPEL